MGRTVASPGVPPTFPRMSLFLLLAFSCLLGPVSSADNGHCIWYGECYTDPIMQNKKNCPYTGPAKSLDISGQKLLSKWCPHLLTGTPSEVLTCCDANQLKTMFKNIQLVAELLQRCPSCLDNLVKHFCDYTCRPDQSTFINVTSIVETPDKNGSYVDKIDLYITNRYLTGTFNSCKKVLLPNTSQGLALDLMCGKWGASQCSAQKWFNFMGDVEDNIYVPFQITYIRTDVSINGFVPVDPIVTPCSKPFNAIGPACSCVDCEESCRSEKKTPSGSRRGKTMKNILHVHLDSLGEVIEYTLKTSNFAATRQAANLGETEDSAGASGAVYNDEVPTNVANAKTRIAPKRRNSGALQESEVQLLLWLVSRREKSAIDYFADSLAANMQLIIKPQNLYKFQASVQQQLTDILCQEEEEG